MGKEGKNGDICNNVNNKNKVKKCVTLQLNADS